VPFNYASAKQPNSSRTAGREQGRWGNLRGWVLLLTGQWDLPLDIPFIRGAKYSHRAGDSSGRGSDSVTDIDQMRPWISTAGKHNEETSHRSPANRLCNRPWHARRLPPGHSVPSTSHHGAWGTTEPTSEPTSAESTRRPATTFSACSWGTRKCHHFSDHTGAEEQYCEPQSRIVVGIGRPGSPRYAGRSARKCANGGAGPLASLYAPSSRWAPLL